MERLEGYKAMKRVWNFFLILALILPIEPVKGEADLKFENDMDTIEIADMPDPFVEEDFTIKISNKTSKEDFERFKEYLDFHGNGNRIELEIDEVKFDENDKLTSIKGSYTLYDSDEKMRWSAFNCPEMGFVKFTLPYGSTETCGSPSIWE